MLTGCQKEIIKEAGYSSLANESILYGIKLGDSVSTVEDVLGKPTSKLKEDYNYENKQLTLKYNDDDQLSYIESKDPAFLSSNGLHVGNNNFDITIKSGNTLIHELPSKNSDEKVAFSYDESSGKSIFYLLKNNHIVKMAVGSDSLNKVYNDFIGSDSKDILEDDKFISTSAIFEGQIDYDKNAQLIRGSEFKSYLNQGIIEGAPVVVGGSQWKMERQIGKGSIVSVTDDGVTTYLYKNFDVYYDVTNSAISGIRLPLDESYGTISSIMKGTSVEAKKVGKQTYYTYNVNSDFITSFISAENNPNKIVDLQIIENKSK